MRKHYTSLVEMLVVMAIIAVLAGLLMAGVAKAKKKGQDVKVRAFMSAVQLAVKEFEKEYQQMPVASTVTQPLKSNESEGLDMLAHLANYRNKAGVVVQVLQDSSSAYTTNTKGIQFLNWDSNSDVLDPWKHPYEIYVDTDFDERISLDGKMVNGMIHLRCIGYDKNNAADDIKTWK